MCHITPLEVEIAIGRRKFDRKLFDLIGDSCWSCDSFFIGLCFNVVIVILLVFFFMFGCAVFMTK